MGNKKPENFKLNSENTISLIMIPDNLHLYHISS